MNNDDSIITIKFKTLRVIDLFSSHLLEFHIVLSFFEYYFCLVLKLTFKKPKVRVDEEENLYSNHLQNSNQPSLDFLYPHPL